MTCKSILIIVFILISNVKSQFQSLNSITCHLCDGFEEDCYGSSCTGVACIKRSVIINGIKRVQKMCQMSDNGYTVEKCYETILWQGKHGEECICQRDWCNHSTTSSFNIYLLILFILIQIFIF
uniref:Protein quiver n=1 Tax=Strongyloides venezuelensis TaxID=75913 RepID=A0A0K0EYT5_STRVS